MKLAATIKNSREFLDLFYKPEIDKLELTKKTRLSLFVLRIDGGRFAYEDMKKQLGNAAITYVFSRNQYRQILRKEMHEAVKKVQDAFRNADENQGEGGELFLYCFLETHLQAPKILSKMELKTAGNDYVKGADGIHLLDLGQGHFHLIFGESKMIGDSTEKKSSFRKAIFEAMASVKKMETTGLGGEITLVDSNLMKEAYDESTLTYLKKIIKPSARNESVTKFNAFGIFVGFEVDINGWDLDEMDDKEFEVNLKKEIRQIVEDKIEYIKKQINDNNLSGYHFYIYAVPFIKKGDISLDRTRKDIIKYIQ